MQRSKRKEKEEISELQIPPKDQERWGGDEVGKKIITVTQKVSLDLKITLLFLPCRWKWGVDCIIISQRCNIFMLQVFGFFESTKGEYHFKAFML